MKSRQRGATLLLLMVLLVTAVAAFGVAGLQRGTTDARRNQDQQNIAMGIAALRSAAFVRRCADRTRPLNDLLPCADAATTEGVSAASCPGLTQGWLPWRTLGLPPLRDSSGTCLWYERQGTTARVIVAGAATGSQNRGASSGRTICGGNLAASNYLDTGDAAVSMTLNTAAMVARCP
jgi:hypothetical protein